MNRKSTPHDQLAGLSPSQRLFSLFDSFDYIHLGALRTEAAFLDEIQTQVLRLFLLAIQSHLFSFELIFLFLQWIGGNAANS